MDLPGAQPCTRGVREGGGGKARGKERKKGRMGRRERKKVTSWDAWGSSVVGWLRWSILHILLHRFLCILTLEGSFWSEQRLGA